ncbi:hypothetical protein M2138_001890 [Dysgonomonadaceae bacterium PH5-43]|nr:hypothetical protein [Dysgonomonadaceae bacterium PH5-43]
MIRKIDVRNIFVFLLSLFCLYSCTSNVNNEDIEPQFVETKIKQNDSKLILDPPMKKGAANIESIVESSEIIPLETNSESLIGSIDDIKFDQELIFIADKRKTSTLFIYSKEGDFLRKIYRKGNAGEEYLSFDGFDLDVENKLIYILDGTRGSILVWDYQGNYVDKYNLPCNNINTFMYLNNGCFYIDFGFRQNAFIKDAPHNLVLYNTVTDSLENSFFPFDFDMFKLRILDNSIFYKQDNKVFYKPLLSNNVFEIEKDSLNPILECDLDGFEIPISSYYLTNKEFEKEQETKHYAQIGKYLNFENWIYTSIDRNTMSAHYFYNKETQQGFLDLSFVMNKNGFIAPDIYQCDDNSFCGWIMPEQLYLFDPNTVLLQDDNPFLVIYNLKQ